MTTYDREDWQALYDERAAISEIDGNLRRDSAEILAFGECVNRYMAQNPTVDRDTARKALSWLLTEQVRRSIGVAA
jgi:hypothetical protein